jgi:foldase protein PrsA
MSKRVRLIAALGAVLFAGTGLVACGGGVPGDAVAQVEGQSVSKATFQHWLGIVAASTSTLAETKPSKPVTPEPPAYTACIAHLKEIEPKPAKGQKPKTEAELKTQCEQQYKELLQQALGFLISYDWVEKEAAALGVKIGDHEVVKHLNELKKQEYPKEAEFQKFLERTKYTVSDLLLRVKLQMLSQKIEEKVTKSGKNVSDADVEKYYNEHKSQYGQPERRDLRVVLTKTEAQAKQAKSEIESGKSFASVAKSKSIEPTSKAAGGELPGVVKGEEQKAFSEAIFAANKGVLSGPVKTPFGYYIFEVKAVHAPTQQSLSAVKSTIKQQLVSQGQQTSLSKFVKEFQKKWKAKTECRAGYVVQDCSQFKDPKTTTAAAGAAATGG